MNNNDPARMTVVPSARNQRAIFIIAAICMILAAFLRCYTVSRDLKWFYDTDFYRDMSFVQGILNGHFGKDPTYLGEYIWYNPLLTLVETGIVKLTGLPINIVLIRAGSYLNLLSPLCFFGMLLFLFKERVALAGLLSFLFLASGNIPFYCTATYSPWIYPGSFTQFVFYLNIIFCYLAYATQKDYWFAILGVGVGLSFLGHMAPTVIIILLLVVLHAGEIRTALKSKQPGSIKKYLLQALFVFLPFVMVSFPYLYYLVGKYHVHIINRKPFEYVDTIFIWRDFGGMIRADASVSFLIAMTGFVWFYKKFHQPLIRKIIFAWFWVALGMFIYSTLVVSADEHLHLHLPGTVPSYHYFFYLKALQSVFFGFGLVFLVQKAISWMAAFTGKRFGGARPGANGLLFILVVGACALIYYPFYKTRFDFSYIRAQSIVVGKETDRIAVYTYILDHIPDDQVFLCEQGNSTFPVLATARKMVSNGINFSNPFVDFDKRENDRNSMLSFLRTGEPDAARNLFKQYSVAYLLLDNSVAGEYKNLQPVQAKLIYRNGRFSLFHIAYGKL